MKKTFLTIALIMGAASGWSQTLEDWNKGSEMSRPCTWWHWMDGNVTREGITKDLEAMAKAGYHEAQIFNVGYGYPPGQAKYLSAEWLDMVKWAATEAKRLGMELCFHNGPGWSSSGGYWVKPEQSMQRVVWTETSLQGTGKTQHIHLDQPKAERNWYQDIVVLALPKPKEARRIRDYVLKSLGSQSYPNLLMPTPEVVDEKDICPKDQIVNLTGKMTPEGELDWDAPSGEWTILRMGHTSTGKDSHPTTAFTGGGLEVDKMSREALDQYWKDGVQPILDHLGPLVGTALTNCLVDSYEVGCGNWTKDFAKEFERLRGYNPIPYFPTLAGMYVGSSEESERFLYDLRATVNELMVKNYYDRFSELCHEHGLKYSVEPYTGPFNDLEVGASSDIVMGEFWMGNTAMPTSAKVAASIAHINGNKVVGAESFTADERYARWNGSPAHMKSVGDMAWTEGINHYIFHTFVHQPVDEGPGYTLGQFGSHLNRLNTLWDASIPYMDYVTRSQYLLQQGTFVGDVLVWTGEVSPNDGNNRKDIKQMGYDYDEIWTAQMEQLSVKNGKLITRSGGEYRVLALLETEWMSPRVLKCLKRLATQGATIVGKKPSKSPSLQDYPQCDAEVQKLADELWGKGLIRQESVKDALVRLKVKPDFDPGLKGQDLRYIHRSAPEGEIYFVCNPDKQFRNEECKFRVTGMVPERWDAQTGTVTTLPYRMNGDGTTAIDLQLDPEQSAFIIFRPKKEGVSLAQTNINYNQEPQVLPSLKIVKAEYGNFMPRGVNDVTDLLQAKVKDGKLYVNSDNGTMGGDPCFGQVKGLAVYYTFNGQKRHEMIPENSHMQIPAAHEKGELKILRAFYGAITPTFDSERPGKPFDVTEKIRQNVAEGKLTIAVSDELAGTKVEGTQKLLRLTYETEGITVERDIAEGHEVDFTYHGNDGRVVVENGNAYWITPYAGLTSAITNKGEKLTAKVKKVPARIMIEGKWDVSFEPGKKAPEKITMDSLQSYTESADKGIKYFSGTAVYTKSVNIPKACLKDGNELILDLGNVGVIAKVKLNRKLVGTAWKAPYRLDITQQAKAGVNELEITVTNNWANRLIGDEQPGAERVGKASWNHWKADSPLEPSGLMGPVVIQPYVKCMLK